MLSLSLLLSLLMSMAVLNDQCWMVNVEKMILHIVIKNIKGDEQMKNK